MPPERKDPLEALCPWAGGFWTIPEEFAMLYVVLILVAGYLAFLVWERRINERAHRSFRAVIHVNGIRGKTSVCRMIDAHLRGAGLRVFTKTTGSAACFIGVDGAEHEIERHTPSNIREQLAMIRRAHREKAEVLILECMAVQPELQQFAQQNIVKGTLNVITNVRYDHMFEMGESLEEIAESLSGTIPRNGVLFTADETFYPFFKEKCAAQGCEAVLCIPDADAPGENEAIACAVGARLGVAPETFRAHMRTAYQEDFGGAKRYQTDYGIFLNLFSANDPQSTAMLLRRSLPEQKHLVFLYNNRADRPDRLLLFVRCFFPKIPCEEVIVMGEARPLACRLLRRGGVQTVEAAASWREALEKAGGRPMVGIGNIKGQAYEMIRYFEEASHE